jgi:hypothetical protein
MMNDRCMQRLYSPLLEISMWDNKANHSSYVPMMTMRFP